MQVHVIQIDFDVSLPNTSGKTPLVNIIKKREEILNSSLSSGSPELIIVLVAMGLFKPVIKNQNSRFSRRSFDFWVLEIIAGNGAVKEKRSVQASKLSTTESK